MKVPFNDFQRHYAAVRGVVEPAVKRVLESGWYVLGKEVEAFEAELAAYLGCRHCVGVGNGTDAITLALMAAGVKPGDEVITTSMTAYPTITGIERAGATPVAVSIDRETGLLDVASAIEEMGEKTRAIVPVHLYGQSCDLEPLLAAARERGVAVIEDCAQSIGATYRGKKTGTWGLAGAFSFYPTKNLGCFGDGGAVATDSDELAAKLRSLRNYGQTDRYHHGVPGLNSRLDEMQAAILRAKLPLLDGWNARRREIAQRYREAFKLEEPLVEKPYGEPVYHLFVVRTPADREVLMSYLKECGVGCLIHYPKMVYQQEAYRGRTGQVCELAPFRPYRDFELTIVSLPIYPEMTDEEVGYVIQCVKGFRRATA